MIFLSIASLTDTITYNQDVLEGQKAEISRKVKSMDWNTYKEVSISVEVFEINVASDLEDTAHPVLLNFRNVLNRYGLSQNDKASIILFVERLLKKNLVPPMQLVEIIDESRGGNTAALPCKIVVRGPADQSDLASAYVMQILEDNKQDLLNHMKLLNPNAFGVVNVSIETYDILAITLPSSEMEETEHPVLLNFEDLPAGTRLSRNDRADIVKFVEDLLFENLGNSFELVSCEDATKDRIRRLQTRRLRSISLPLSITVKGPAEDYDLALGYVLEVLYAHKEDLARMLKTREWTTYKDVQLSFEMYDPNAMAEMVETIHPVRLKFEDVPAGFRLSRDDKAEIIRLVDTVLVENLHESIELVKVAESRNGRSLSLSSRRLDTVSLPLLITVRGCVFYVVPQFHNHAPLPYSHQLLLSSTRPIFFRREGQQMYQTLH